MSSAPFARTAILGPGLLGGSIAQALKQRSPQTHVRIWARRQAAIDDLAGRALCDLASTDLRSVAQDADFIVLCTPMEAMPDLARELAALPLKPDCVLTDVGSAKTLVAAALETIFQNSPASYLGSHPMAGSEKAGIEASRPDLFDGAACILTPTLFTADHALHRVRAFWRLLGCRILEMPPEEHDRKIARISHMPHLCAAAIAHAALQHDVSAAECAGNGFRDATRIASGDPPMWTGILLQNRTEVLGALTQARNTLSDLVAILENVDDKALRRFLSEAKNLRDQVTDKA